MRALVARDLADANVQGLSADRKNATAYNAALQAAANGCAALRGRSLLATHIDTCVARRRRLPMAIGDSVVRTIDRVDP